MFYVYLLKSEVDNKFYTGCTLDLRRRLIEHNSNKIVSTKNRGPFKLVYYEAYKSKKDAFIREHNLKLRANALTGLKRRIVNSIKDL